MQGEWFEFLWQISSVNIAIGVETLSSHNDHSLSNLFQDFFYQISAGVFVQKRV